MCARKMTGSETKNVSVGKLLDLWRSPSKVQDKAASCESTSDDVPYKL